MKVLVLDGNTRAALAVTRSLGRANHEVIVGEDIAPSLAQASRYCSTSIVYPSPSLDSAAFVDYLAAVTIELEIDAVIPVADITTFQVTRHRRRFAPRCAVPFADADTVERAADKLDVTRTAQRIGVPVPRTQVLLDLANVTTLEIDFPVVIKPWRSRILTEGGWRSTAVSHAASRDAMIADLKARGAHEFPILLQERISGPGVGVFALYQGGRPTALFSHRRIRERPPWGGVSVLAESTTLDPEATRHATSLLGEIGWDGVAMVEFKRDMRDNTPKLMEINGRFWGSLQLAIDAGVDFPALLVDGLRGQPKAPQPPYEVGVRTRWFWGDVDSLRLSLLDAGRERTRRGQSRLSTVIEFGKLYGANLYYDNPKPYDPTPWALETRQWIRGGTTRGRRSVTDSACTGARTAQAPITVRTYGSLAHQELSPTTWNGLLGRSECNTIFQTHQWTRSCLAAFPHGGQPRIVTAWSGGELTGIAPLWTVPRLGRAPVLRFIGDERSDYCDMIAGAGKRDFVSCVLDAVDREPWGVLELNRVPETSSTPALLQQMARERGLFPLVQSQFICRSLLIAGHEAEAEAARDKASVRRRSNYFARSGRLAFHDYTDASEIEPQLTSFFAQHAARWQRSGAPSLFSDPANRVFYRLLTEALSSTGWLLFSVVTIDQEPLAFHYGFDYNERVLWYKPAFDVARAAHSPGLVMVRHLIDYAILHRRREFDFTIGDESFKRRFTNATTRLLRVRVFRNRVDYVLARSRAGASALAVSLRR